MKKNNFIQNLSKGLVAIAVCLFGFQQDMLAQDCPIAAPACGGGDSPVTVLNEDFEDAALLGLPSGWSFGPGDVDIWEVENDVESFNTGTDTEFCGTQMLVFETSFPAALGSVSSVETNLNLTSVFLNTPIELGFAYYMAGGNVGTLNIRVSTDGGATYTTLFTLTGDQGQPVNGGVSDWQTASVNLDAYFGQNVLLNIEGINGTGGTSFEGDILIDALQVVGCGIPCEIQCPPDVVVSADPGDCSADLTDVQIGSPIISGPCVGMDDVAIFNFDNAFGWTLNDFDGNGAWMIGDGGAFGGNFMNLDGDNLFFDDDQLGIGVINSGEAISPIIDMSPYSASGGSVDFDVIYNDIGNGDFVELQLSGDGGASWMSVWVATSDILPWAAQSFDIPPALLTNQFRVKFIYDDDDSWAWYVAIDNLSIRGVSAPQATNDLTGTSSAAGTYPVGTTTITWTTYDEFGNPVTCVQTITVLDIESPAISCPSDEVIHLDAGECEHGYSFDITVADNCGFFMPSVGGSGFFGDICNCMFSGFSIGCGLPGIAQIQEVSSPAFPAGLEVTQGCFVFDNVSWGVTDCEVRLYNAPAGLGTPPNTPPNWLTSTPVATSGLVNIPSLGGVNGMCICVDFETPFVFDPAVNDGLYLEVFNPGFGHLVANGSGAGTSCNGQTATGFNTYLASQSCVPQELYLCDVGFCNVDAFMDINGILPPVDVTEPDPTAPDGYNEYESGDLLPIGEHCFQYTVEDINGNTNSCAWCVTVEEYPGPYGNLNCNANINVSVDENCEAIICADDVLEGGPYKCYDDYLVTVSGLSPPQAIIGNGTSCVTIKASQLDGWNGMTGESFAVMVTDPDDGNSCWNDGWMIEDKLAPILECPDTITIACTQPTEATADETGMASGASSPNLSFGGNGGSATVDASVTVGGAPAGAIVTDVNVTVGLSHTWLGDVTIELTDPSGANTVTLFNPNCGTQDNINATFDSDSGNNITCGGVDGGMNQQSCNGDYLNNATISGVVSPNGNLDDMNGVDVNGDWTVSFSDGFTPDDSGGCIEDLSIEVEWVLEGVENPTVFENCGQYTLTSDDEVTTFDCGADYAKVIERTWTATDEKGNSGTCLQVIQVEFANLSGVILPPNYDDLDQPALDCTNADTSVDNLGAPEGGCDNIQFTHEDIHIEICEGSYKILRKWTILDWCTGDIVIHHQTIKVLDKDGPNFAPIADLDESTTNNSCEANIILPTPVITDNCSSAANISYTVDASAGDLFPQSGGWVIYGLPLGTHTVTYEATDDCGNTSEISFDINVTDEIVPVAICETYHVVSLTTEEPTLVYATTFDDGSYDNCEIESMEVRRMTPPTPCIDFDWTTNGPGIDEIPNGLVNQRDRGMTFWYPAVPFACCDVGGEHLVEFRVTDIHGNSNTCMVTITVDDKLDPVVTCPADKTYECSEYYNVPSDLPIDGLNQNGTGAPAYYVELNGPGNADNDTTFVGYYANAYDNCEATVYIRDVGSINECGITEPWINRFYTAVDGGGRTDVCVQRLTVVNNDPFNITDTFCNGFNNGDDVVWPCDATLTTCDALTDPAQTGEPIVDDNTCSLVAVTYQDLPLPIVDDACYKILRTWTIIDWCQYDNNVNPPVGIWTYEQIIKVENSSAPEFDSCDDQEFCIDSSTGGNCLADVLLEAVASDDCTPEAELNYSYWVDLYNDGTDDIGPAVNQPFGLPAVDQDPSDFYHPHAPEGTHLIKWTVEDGCGNITACEYLFIVEDCDGPTAYALNGLAVDLGQQANADVWATDLDNGSFDNCNDICDYRIGVPSGGPGQSAPPTADHYNFTCDDLDLYGSNIPVDLWVKDCANNWSYVSTYILLEDNMGVCDGSGPQGAINGSIETEMTESVEDVQVSVTGNAPGIPSSVYTDNTGLYGMPGLPLGYNYEVTPEMNLDPLNGVSTYDLVLISKHILELQLLDSPYKLIAADVNNSGTITTFDMVELRKLILFINTEFQNNTSWRFVEADFVFDNPANPWATSFPEVTNINNLAGVEIADYIGIKTGDVNASAIPNSLVGGEDRTTVDDLVFRVDDQKMVAGEEYTVEFTAKDFANVMGYQFSLSFDQDAVEFVDVNAGSLVDLTAANFGLSKVNEGVITTSWNNSEATALKDSDVVFSVTFTAKSAAQLSDVMSISSRYTVSEAYNAELELMGVAIEYNSENGVVAANGFDLYQNTPNPFKDETVIGFSLPEATTATLKVYDVAGRVLKSVDGEFAKGYNEISLNRGDLAGTGVLYYTLETDTDSATKKMIIIE